MKRLFNILWILLPLVIILPCLAMINPRPKTADIKELKKSCVMVFSSEGHGSGAIVGKNCVLTAAHVARMSNLMIRTDDNEIYGVVSVAIDPNSDMALIYISREFKQKPLRMSEKPLELEDEIIMIGTPSITDLFNTVLRGRVVKIDVNTTGADWTNLDIVDAHGSPGTSGGPIFDNTGNIRGIVVTGCGNLMGAIPMEEFDFGR